MIRANWAVFLIASIFLWVVTILVLTVKYDTVVDIVVNGTVIGEKIVTHSTLIDEFAVWKSWIAQNFDWCAPSPPYPSFASYRNLILALLPATGCASQPPQGD